jgi:hypothetical protein
MVQLYGRCLGKVFTFFSSNTYLNSWYWERISWTWFNSWWRKNVNQECISSCGSLHEGFCSNKQRLGHLSLLVPSRSSFCLKFCMLLTRVSHSRALCCGVSKWKLIVWQSTHGLCETSQDNTMMTWFLRDEMTLKTTLLVWEPMVTSNGLVSCVINFYERFWPSMTLIGIGVLFSTRANLYYRTNSLSKKMLMR